MILISGFCYLVAFLVPFLNVEALTFYDGVAQDDGERRYTAVQILAASKPPTYFTNSVLAVSNEQVGDFEVIREWDEGNGRSVYFAARLLTLVLFAPQLFFLLRYCGRHSSLSLKTFLVLLVLIVGCVIVLLTFIDPMIDLVYQPVSRIEVYFGEVSLASGVWWAGVSLLLGVAGWRLDVM
jgi:hypothetical protein